MKYLKTKNTPLKILQKSKFHSYDGQIAWDECGFNPIIVSSKSIQYVNMTDDMIQYIPISDNTKFDAIWTDLQAETTALGDPSFTVELLDDTDGSLYIQWKADREARA